MDMKRIVCLLLFWAALSHLPMWGASLIDYREKLYNLFIEQKIPQWSGVLSQMSADKSCETLDGRHEILCGYYGLVGHLVDKKRKTEAQSNLKTALALAEKYQKLYPHDARFKALYANLLGLKIALSPLKATTLASDMLSSAREAYKMAPDDSWVSILYGNILFYMPGMFGGDKAQGLSCYQHARQGMEKNLSANSHNWLYVQLLVTIGVVNEKNEHYEQALAMYKNIMNKYPNYAFVRDVLYPRAQKAMREKK